MSAPPGSHPSVVIGEQLSAVAFVQDYVEFHFDGPVVRAISNPRVESGGGLFEFPETGSMDALCSMIGARVLNVVIREGDAFVIELENGRIVIPLDGSRSPESAHFQAELLNAPLSIW